MENVFNYSRAIASGPSLQVDVIQQRLMPKQEHVDFPRICFIYLTLKRRS